MQRFSIPTCYFPSTALFLDDSHDFLLNFVLQLDEGVAYRFFDSPIKALKYIQSKRCELDVISQHCLSEYTEAKNGPITNHTINLDLAAVHAEVYNPHRFSEITVVVVDYAMPGMNGLEFCRSIQNNSIKKILLTGAADEGLAIAAFNDGLIHRYIKKNAINAVFEMTKSIYDLQLQYFQAMSNMVVRMLSIKSPSCLEDRKFAQFFSDLREENGIVEYYLVDNSGTFLMLDDDANVSYLMVKNDADIRLHYNFAQDKGGQDSVLEELKRGEKIPGLWLSGGVNHQQQQQDWSSCLVAANRFEGQETYYYAYLKGNVLFDVPTDKIFSYHRYLEELDTEELLLS